MEKYIVDGNLDHNGVQYKSGDVVELTGSEAAQLLAIGRVAKVESDQVTQEPPAAAVGPLPAPAAVKPAQAKPPEPAPQPPTASGLTPEQEKIRQDALEAGSAAQASDVQVS